MAKISQPGIEEWMTIQYKYSWNVQRICITQYGAMFLNSQKQFWKNVMMSYDSHVTTEKFEIGTG